MGRKPNLATILTNFEVESVTLLYNRVFAACDNAGEIQAWWLALASSPLPGLPCENTVDKSRIFSGRKHWLEVGDAFEGPWGWVYAPNPCPPLLQWPRVPNTIPATVLHAQFFNNTLMPSVWQSSSQACLVATTILAIGQFRMLFWGEQWFLSVVAKYLSIAGQNSCATSALFGLGFINILLGRKTIWAAGEDFCHLFKNTCASFLRKSNLIFSFEHWWVNIYTPYFTYASSHWLLSWLPLTLNFIVGKSQIQISPHYEFKLYYNFGTSIRVCVCLLQCFSLIFRGHFCR